MPRTNKVLTPYVILNATILLAITVLGLAAMEKNGIVDINIGPYAVRVEAAQEQPD